MSRSRTTGSRLQANMHSFLLFASLQNCTYIVLNAMRLYCSRIHKLQSRLHPCCICNFNAVHKSKEVLSLTLLMQNLWPRLQSQLSEACLHQCRVETESPIQSLLAHRCSIRVLDSSDYSVQALMVSVALYCQLCIVLQHSSIIIPSALQIGSSSTTTEETRSRPRCVS